jgi:hypothetical protein
VPLALGAGPGAGAGGIAVLRRRRSAAGNEPIGEVLADSGTREDETKEAPK